MKIFDASHLFLGNYKLDKPDRILVFHWTGKGSSQQIVDYLRSRLNGAGTVGYNYIVDTDGSVFKLCPVYAWFHNTGRGSLFDSKSCSIAFVSDGDFPNKRQIQSVNMLVETEISTAVNIVEITHHAALNPDKPDFPDEYWQKLQHYFKFV
jgi:hypothetical protein